MARCHRAAGQKKPDLDGPMLRFFKDKKIANFALRKERTTACHLAGMSPELESLGEQDEPGKLVAVAAIGLRRELTGLDVMQEGKTS